jgi:signal transduction histidine kinase
VTRNGRHLLGLINDILNFARIEAGHVDIHMADVPLSPVLADLESVVAPQLRGASLTFVRDACEDVVVYADAEKVRQILLNLLSNAIKFTAAGGTVEIRCSRAEDSARLTVRDTGIGIEADHLERVFDPFVQLDRTLSSHHEGTGLGLSISRDLARAMGGEVSAESSPGVGSTFVLTLPLARH